MYIERTITLEAPAATRPTAPAPRLTRHAPFGGKWAREPGEGVIVSAATLGLFILTGLLVTAAVAASLA
jgi:hypothetical protein